MKPRIFPVTKDHYALMAGRCGCALFEIKEGEAWVCGSYGYISPETAEAIALGLSGKSNLAESLQAHDSQQPTAASFAELLMLLIACRAARDAQEVARMCGVGMQRIYQLMADPGSMLSREAVQELRRNLELQRGPYRAALLDMIDSMYSRCHPRRVSHGSAG